MENEYSLILTIVDRGRADDVMAHARAAGAAGGTIISGRGAGSKEAAKFFNVTIQEEKEVLLIVTKNERKNGIMTAIAENAGLASTCHGITFSLPVDEVRGIRWQGECEAKADEAKQAATEPADNQTGGQVKADK